MATQESPESLAIIENFRKKWKTQNNQLDLFTSVIVIQEIEHGVLNAQRKHGKEHKKDFFVNQSEFIKSKIGILDYTVEMAKRFAKIKIKLESIGKIVGDSDIMIAATAIEAGLILVTNNTRHFQNIPNLVVEDWTKPFKS